MTQPNTKPKNFQVYLRLIGGILGGWEGLQVRPQEREIVEVLILGLIKERIYGRDWREAWEGS